jgi:hypothetical protein
MEKTWENILFFVIALLVLVQVVVYSKVSTVTSDSSTALKNAADASTAAQTATTTANTALANANLAITTVGSDPETAFKWTSVVPTFPSTSTGVTVANTSGTGGYLATSVNGLATYFLPLSITTATANLGDSGAFIKVNVGSPCKQLLRYTFTTAPASGNDLSPVVQTQGTIDSSGNLMLQYINTQPSCTALLTITGQY